MKLLIWVGWALVQIFIIRFNFFDTIMNLSVAFHTVAQHFIERAPSSWNWFFEAILIGQNEGLKSHSELQSLFTLGLYYLLVVSGIHLLAMEKMLQGALFFLPQKIKTILIFFFLLAFCLANRIQAPCMRAFLSWLLQRKTSLSPPLQGDLQIIITCVCLGLEPSWAQSLSFQLSCGATLALAIASSLEIEKPILRRLFSTCLVSLVTAPLIFSVQPCLSWLIVPANIFAFPFFEAVLMPLSVSTVLLTPLRTLSETVLKVIFKCLEFFSQFEKPLLCLDEKKMAWWGLAYVCAIYLVWRLLLPFYLSRKFWKSQDLSGAP